MPWLIDYEAIIAEAPVGSLEQTRAFLISRLPYAWADAYRSASSKPCDVCVVGFQTFHYIFDYYDSAGNSAHPDYDSTRHDSRLVAAWGHSAPQTKRRDDSRLKGWVGPTEKYFGTAWDKGHFIAHSIGGAVDQCEVNVFPQLRSLNRGWSAAGKRFRAMERYCFQHAGTLCFHRPLYGDGFSRPAEIEFGYLDSNGKLVVERFSNR